MNLAQLRAIVFVLAVLFEGVPRALALIVFWGGLWFAALVAIAAVEPTFDASWHAADCWVRKLNPVACSQVYPYGRYTAVREGLYWLFSFVLVLPGLWVAYLVVRWTIR